MHDDTADASALARFALVVVGLAAIFATAAVATVSLSRPSTPGAGSALLTADDGAIRNGALTLTDDDHDSTLFRPGELLPGHPVSACTKIVYAGELTPTGVTFHAAVDGPLAPFLDVSIEVGTGGSFGDCLGFVPAATIYRGTLAELAEAHSDRSSGLSTFTAVESPSSRTVRFVVEVQSDDAAQGAGASADFTWGTRRIDEHPAVLLDARRDQVPLPDRDRDGLEL